MANRRPLRGAFIIPPPQGAVTDWVVLRVPYPLGFFARGLDGRIDDPNGGWKGRGVWANFGSNLNWHLEGGKGMKSSVVHFQLRPDPLAN